MDIAPEELEICLNVLQRISEDPAMMDHHERFKALVAKIHREGKKSARRAARERLCTADQDLRAMTRMAQAQRDERPAMPIGVEPSGNVIGTLNRSRLCYICKQPYITLHAFYHLLCPDCAELNYARRQQRVDLTGRTALVTGGRIKIGYQTALRMLRDG